MNNERLEILMGRFFDGEIEPSELRLLNAQLDSDPQSRRLFEEYQSLHKLAQTEIAPLAETGRSFESIFTAAWKTARRKERRIVRTPAGSLRFVSGMAAGVLIAVLIQVGMRPDRLSSESPAVGTNTQAASPVVNPDSISNRPTRSGTLPVIKDVDYYYYVDESGQQWLIEGYRERIRPQLASYQDI